MLQGFSMGCTIIEGMQARRSRRALLHAHRAARKSYLSERPVGLLVLCTKFAQWCIAVLARLRGGPMCWSPLGRCTDRMHMQVDGTCRVALGAASGGDSPGIRERDVLNLSKPEHTLAILICRTRNSVVWRVLPSMHFVTLAATYMPQCNRTSRLCCRIASYLCL